MPAAADPRRAAAGAGAPWTGLADQLVRVNEVESQVLRMLPAGQRFEVRSFTGDHLVVASFDGTKSGVDWLGEHRAPATPRHVRYVVDPAEGSPALGLDNDSAYWLSGIRLRDAGRGELDVVRHNSGAGAPPASGLRPGAGVERGTSVPLLGYVSQSQEWLPAAPEVRADRLSLQLRNIRELTVDVRAAGLPCDAALQVVTDGPVTVALEGCGRAETFGHG